MDKNELGLQDRLLKLEIENSDLKAKLERFEDNEKMFHALVETAVGNIGEDFFTIIAEKLSDWLNAECVIIGKLISENTVQGFPMYLDGEIIEGFTYQLQGTPCDLTHKKGYCVYPDDVGTYFPESKDIKDMNAKGYVGTALYDKMGEPKGILCAMSRNKLRLPPQAEDILRIIGARITSEIDRIKAQNELEVSKEKLKRANNSKDRLFSIISHDLKNPFQVLIGLGDLAEKSVESANYEEVSEYLELMNQTSQNTHKLLQNLLEWSLSQIGGKDFNPEYFELNSLTKELIDFESKFASQKGVSLSAKIPEKMNVYADYNMLNTILRNLVANAIKFTNSGDSIEIRAKDVGSEIRISVLDTGVGIEKENIKLLFNLDTSFSERGTNDERGSGLGLILCKEFVDQHNGNIWVESTPGEFTEFSFTLPAK